jgi:hypothetical protein
MTLADTHERTTKAEARPRHTLSDMKLPEGSRPAPAGGVGQLEPGTVVEVRSSFDKRWTHGFEVIRLSEQGYRLRRLSDGEALPGFFPPDDVRKERRGGTWWY